MARWRLWVPITILVLAAFGYGYVSGERASSVAASTDGKTYLAVVRNNAQDSHETPPTAECGTPTSEPTRDATNTVETTATSDVTPTSTSGSEGTPTPTATPTPSATSVPDDLLESFEGTVSSWQVSRDVAAGGTIVRSGDQAAVGSFSAKLSTQAQGARARLHVGFADAATTHTWEERPGTWHWQRNSVYLPSATVAKLGSNEYLTLAGLWSNGAGYGWFLRVRQGGELFVVGTTTGGNEVEFRAYGTLPQDRWVDLELGLHSQAGPGVKRAFAFLIDGSFYGWYRQGKMENETYDRAAVGILDTNSAAPLSVFVDRWQHMSAAPFPGGLDSRPTAALQEQDFRNGSGVQVQYDWSTWEYGLTLHPQFGIFSAVNRLQAGRNIDRMPDLTSGWAEIEIDWPNGTPSTAPTSYFGPMVGFRKEINREENLEVIPIGQGGGKVNLAFEAWVGNPVILAEWPMPASSVDPNSHIPEPGDIIRARWEQINATTLHVQASYYDASANQWYTNIIDGNYNITNVDDTDGSTDAVNYTDGYHTASSITIDSTSYSIRRYKVGTLDSYPN